MKYKVIKIFESATSFSDGKVVEFKKDEVIENAEKLFTPELIIQLTGDGMIEVDKEHTITQEDLDSNPYLAGLGAEVGQVIYFDPATVTNREEAIAAGLDVDALEARVKKQEDAKAKQVEEDAAKSVSEPKKFFEGKLIVVDSYRTVNDKQYHNIRLEDGTTQDLTEEQYSLGVTVEVKK